MQIIMKTVKDLLADKGDQVWSVSPDQSVLEAISLMAEKNVGALMVVQDSSLAGIVSERDYTRSIVLQDRSSKGTTVREIMTENVTTVEPQHTIEDCMTLMTEKSFRHLPVLQDGKLVGVLSMPDLVRAVVAEQQNTISQLKDYISQ
jgi:CBS domain-containing protein